jgi:ABC-type dipeptide/oligopeptide/nickel transport system permease component
MEFRKHGVNLILATVLPIVFLYVGLVVTFFLVNSLPGDIVLCYLPPSWTLPQYEAMVRQLGLDQPLFIQFLRYIGDFLTGNWGVSCSVSAGAPIYDLVNERLSRIIEVLILPLLIGINLGFIFGKISKRTKRNWLKKGIQLLSAVGIAIPVFSFSMYLQYNLSYVAGAFPAIGYKTAGFDDPPFITGFRILDSIISGNGALAMDTILHYILPTIVLTVAITALMTRVFGSKFAGHSEKKKTIISITAKSSAVFSVILTYLILIDVTFNLNGFGSLFVAALYNADILVLRGLMGVIIILLVITIFVSILSFTLIGIVRDKKHPPQKDLKDTTEKEPRISGTIELKNFLKKIIRSPITIIGIVLVIIPIIVSIFPELISGYTFEEAQGIFAGAWAPASPLHPLGTSKFGRDVLAQVAYGTRNSLIFGFGAVLIGLIGGVIFGPLASKYKRVIHPIITGSMLIFYIFPGILLIMIFAIITVGGPTFGLLMFTTGFLLIPSFTRIIANSEFRIVPIIKKVLTYVPLFAGFAIILYLALGFLGFSDPLTIQLGRLVSLGREHMFDAPWASLWPGFIAFLIVISLLVLHEGLANSSR